MSAAELIEKIKRLPEDKCAEVARFIEQLDEQPAEMPTVRYADRERARGVSARVFESHEELFRKLAE